MVSAFLRIGLLLLAGLAVPSQAGPPDWLLEADISPPQTTVQTQATYRLRFFQGVDIRDLKITGPSVALGDVRPIDKGRIYEMQHQGRRYRVHEHRYAIFPFTAGELKIAGAQVVGTPVQGSALHLDAAEQRLKVSSLPSGHSLAARSLVLSESWEVPATNEIETNQTIRRRVRVEATGIDAGQIPAWPFEVPGMSVHAEPAQLENHFDNGLNVASRTQTFKLAPLRTGAIDIPGSSLRWWNPSDGTSATATLPSRKLQVLGEAMATPRPPAVPPKEMPVTAIILAGALSLIASALWFFRSKLRRAWRLERALRSGDPIVVRDGILAWVQPSWPEATPPTLGRLAETLNKPSARQAAESLDRLVYGPGIGDYTPKQLARLALQIQQGLREQS